MYILFFRTNKKTGDKKKCNSPFSILILSYKGSNIYNVYTKKGWGGLETCHVFTDSIGEWVSGGWFVKVITV